MIWVGQIQIALGKRAIGGWIHLQTNGCLDTSQLLLLESTWSAGFWYWIVLPTSPPALGFDMLRWVAYTCLGLKLGYPLNPLSNKTGEYPIDHHLSLSLYIYIYCLVWFDTPIIECKDQLKIHRRPVHLSTPSHWRLQPSPPTRGRPVDPGTGQAFSGSWCRALQLLRGYMVDNGMATTIPTCQKIAGEVHMYYIYICILVDYSLVK